jgi:hypothetical protein
MQYAIIQGTIRFAKLPLEQDLLNSWLIDGSARWYVMHREWLRRIPMSNGSGRSNVAGINHAGPLRNPSARVIIPRMNVALKNVYAAKA